MWALWAASRLCPSCITELGGVWHIGWKLAWSFACVRHQRLLIDSCPTCHQTLGARRTRSRPLFFGRIPTPGFCMNSAATLGQRSGYRSPMCGTPLGELESVELAHVSPIIAAQRQIDTVLNRGPAVALKGEIRPLDYFQSLKRICAMILLSASPCDLGDLPRSVLGAFEQHVAERERSIRRVGSEGRRVAFHLNAPRSPELMAAVASLAVRIRADVPSEVLTKRPQRMNRLQFERDRWPLVREYLR